ncbi:MAG: phage portal protein [Armatimonadota bacterium]|nr:phage portal protein [Armatimonadota bacterium]
MRGGTRAKSGVVVNSDTALQVTTALACVKKLADALASVPVKVYRARDGKREEARDHPLYDVLATQPNQRDTSLEFRETLAFHMSLTGNAFCHIVRVGNRVVELIPIDPGKVTIIRGDARTTYTIDGQTDKVLTTDQIWHLRGPSWNGHCGLDAVRLLREALGLAMATEQSHAAIHANGVMPSGMVSFKATLDEPNLIRAAAWVKANYAGLENAAKAMVMDKEATWTPFRMTGVDSEHIETRKMQAQEICHGFNVLPIMIGISENNTSYASSEQMFNAHLVHTVRPLHSRVAGSMDRWLLSPSERKAGFYTGFVVADFINPAMKDKAEFYKIALGGGGAPGWLTPNEVRAFDELASYEGGDHLYVPVNTRPMEPDGMPKGTVAPSIATDPNAPSTDPNAPPEDPNAPPAGFANVDRLAIGRVLSSENEKLLREASGLIGDADTKLDDVLKKLDKEEKPDGT